MRHKHLLSCQPPLPLAAPVINVINGREGRVIILNPTDHLRGLVGVRWLDNGHEDKVPLDDLL